MAAEIPQSFITSSVISTLIFLFLVIIMINTTLFSLKSLKERRLKISLTITSTLIAWFLIVVFLGRQGFFEQQHLIAPNLLLTFIVLFVALKKAYHSKILRTIFDAVKQHWIIAIQTYRVVGIAFLSFYNMGLLPGLFAFPAGLGDMFVGITAPFVALFYFLKKSYYRKLAIYWNYIGIADLVVALSIGILAFSWSIQIVSTEVPTNALSLSPLILVPAFTVPIAMMLHLFSLRTLKKERFNKEI